MLTVLGVTEAAKTRVSQHIQRLNKVRFNGDLLAPALAAGALQSPSLQFSRHALCNTKWDTKA
jgi:hypothetical protein